MRLIESKTKKFYELELAKDAQKFHRGLFILDGNIDENGKEYWTLGRYWSVDCGISLRENGVTI